MNYELKFTQSFIDEVKEITSSNCKFGEILKKVFPPIKNNPHKKAEFLSQLGCWRKHVIAEKYRILYDIDPNRKVVNLLHIRLKNKGTYRR